LVGSLAGALALIVTACGGDDASSAPETGGSAGSGTGGSATAGSGGSGTAGSGGTVELVPQRTALSACRAYITAWCYRRYLCGTPGENAESCVYLNLDYCPDHSFAPGTTRPIDQMFDCAETLATYDCELIARGIPPDCVTAGTRQPGEPCISPAQCDSLSCNGDQETCGECLDTIRPGEPCEGETRECGISYECYEGICQRPLDGSLDPPEELGAGDECDDHDICPEDLVCSDPTGTGTDTCQPIPGLGEPCEYPGYYVVDACQDGLRCDGNTAVCVPNAALGEACGPIDGQDVYCADGLLCQTPDLVSAGVCVEMPSLGDACGYVDSDYIPCPAELQCDDESSDPGTCVARQAIGEPCDEPSDVTYMRASNCAIGLVCTPDGACADPAVEGAPCTATTYCEPAAACTDGVCVGTGDLPRWDAFCGDS
jgi:hypothetical protein